MALVTLSILPLGPQGLSGSRSTSALYKSIPDKSVMEPLASQQANCRSIKFRLCPLEHTDGLRTLTEPTKQRNFDHILASIAVFNGTKGKTFLSE